MRRPGALRRLSGVLAAALLGCAEGGAIADLRPIAREAERIPNVAPAPSLQAFAVADEAFALEDPTGALRPFFAALRATEARRDGAVTRVLHMGDSSIGLDGLPHAIRRRMQDRFGDAGPGFLLLDRYSANYRSNVADIRAEGWDVCYIAYLCRKDGHYGLGGHSFRGGAGAWSKISPRPGSDYGREISRAELWFARAPRGGRLKVRVDDGEFIEVDTRAENLSEGWYPLELPRGEHVIEVRAGGHGVVHGYGLVLENDGPGVVWDTVSMIGAFTKRLQGYSPAHIQAQLQHRKPDLLVLNYGGNDLRRIVSKSVTPKRYIEEYRSVLRTLRGEQPSVPCLIVSVIDHGRSGSQIVEAHHVDAMVAAQREVARAEGCAFFDSVAAMGGAGALRKWLQRSPRLAEPDLKHLNHRGRDLMGGYIFDALMEAYAAQGQPLARKVAR